MGLQRAVELIQHDARAHNAPLIFNVQFQDAVEVLGVVQN